jgi:hypothetical protein
MVLMRWQKQTLARAFNKMRALQLALQKIRNSAGRIRNHALANSFNS